MRRHPMKRSTSRRTFTRNAEKVHKKNLQIHPMRGGIRL